MLKSIFYIIYFIIAWLIGAYILGDCISYFLDDKPYIEPPPDG